MEKREPFEDRMAILVGRYTIPLAVLLVSLGVILAQPQGWVREWVIGLLIFGVVFNMGFQRIIGRPGPAGWAITLRLGVNIFVNTVTVYLLGSYWPQIWLLLALTPIATAVYGTRARTLAASAGIGVILLGIQALRPANSPISWGQQAAQCAFIVLMSLLINELSALAREGVAVDI